MGLWRVFRNKIIIFFVIKNEGKMARAQGKWRKNTGNLVLILALQPCVSYLTYPFPWTINRLTWSTWTINHLTHHTPDNLTWPCPYPYPSLSQPGKGGRCPYPSQGRIWGVQPTGYSSCGRTNKLKTLPSPSHSMDHRRFFHRTFNPQSLVWNVLTHRNKVNMYSLCCNYIGAKATSLGMDT